MKKTLVAYCSLFGLIGLSIILTIYAISDQPDQSAIAQADSPVKQTLAIAPGATGFDGFAYNMDYETRDKLLGLQTDWENSEIGGIDTFADLDIETLNTLIELKFINPEDRQNESPTALEIQAFMSKYPQVKACGYAVSPFRNDYRVTIDSIYVEQDDVTDELRTDFINISNDADEVYTDYELSAWWD